MKKWVTVAKGFWRMYNNKRVRPGFVEYTRYPGDLDFEARVQVVKKYIRAERKRGGRK